MFTREYIHTVVFLIGQDDAMNCSIEFLQPWKGLGTYVFILYSFFVYNSLVIYIRRNIIMQMPTRKANCQATILLSYVITRTR